MNNKVAILGNDHINTLGVIRTLGENNIKPYLFLISENRNNAIIKSKYIEKYWILKNEDEALKKIVDYFKEEENKVALIPTSDATSLCIDKKVLELKDKFYIPNIDFKNNYIYMYMDKFKQQELIESNNINGIKSQILNFSNFDEKLKLTFPIILKPNISAEGNKDDIRICNDKNELNKAKEELKKLGYKKILVQNFITYDYECDIQGFSINGETCIPGVIEKIRIYPAKKGSTTYGKVVSNQKYEKVINGIGKIMKKINYTGIFDIDVFICNEEIYLNEINFRNSAISYAYGDSYIAYYWYLSVINNKVIEPPLINSSYTFMDDQADIHNIIDKNITFKRYRKEKKEARILLVKNKKDPKPSRMMFINKVKNNIFK